MTEEVKKGDKKYFEINGFIFVKDFIGFLK